MNESGLILCERSGKWAVAIARHLAPAIRLRQTRSLAECVDVLTGAPASLLAVEMTEDNLAGVLALVSEVAARFPSARAVVLAERGLERHEWLAREAGAVHFIASSRQSASLAVLAGRHLSAASGQRADWAAQIVSALPWSDVA